MDIGIGPQTSCLYRDSLCAIFKQSIYGSNSCVCLCVRCAEIKAVPDLNLETDLKLDKLESFLGKLNSKGQSCSVCCLLVQHDLMSDLS